MAEQLRVQGKLSLDKRGFTATLDQASKGVQKFGTQLKSRLAGAFAAGAIISFTRRAIDAVVATRNFAKSLNIGVESFQELEFAAKEAGANTQDVANAFRTLSKARQDALKNPGGRFGDIFSKAFGLDAAELQVISIDALFRHVAETIRTTDFGADELGIASDLLSEAGVKLIPAFRDGLDEAAAKARELGLVFTEDVADGIDKSAKQMDRLTKRLSVFAAQAATIFNKTIDLLDNVIGTPASYIGGLIHGEGGLGNRHRVAAQIAREHADKTFQNFIGPPDATAKPDQPDRDKVELPPLGATTTKPARAARGRTGGGGGLGSIGAFVGQSALRSLEVVNKDQLREMRRIESALTRQGILIKDAR